jgi:trans-aconitate 2-methyltransferase
MFKKILLITCSFSILVTPLVEADDSYWDNNLVRSYVHNSELQRRWAMSFLALNLKQLKGNERILDIGCGDGKITADIARFIPEGCILGIDPSKAMLNWAKKQFNCLDYPNLSFQEGGFIEPNINEQFDVIISCCALQHCLDHKNAFKNMHSLLKQGGKLHIMIPAMNNSEWKQARINLQTNSKWMNYWKAVVPRKFLSIEESIDLLKASQFDVIRVKKVLSKDPFVDREEFLSFLLGTFTPVVPEELSKEFWSDMIDEYVRLNPDALRTDGVIEARFGRIEIEARCLDY